MYSLNGEPRKGHAAKSILTQRALLNLSSLHLVPILPFQGVLCDELVKVITQLFVCRMYVPIDKRYFGTWFIVSSKPIVCVPVLIQ